MNISTDHRQGRVPVTVLRVQGGINAGSVEAVRTAIRRAVESGTRYLLLDLSEVPFVSSVGLRVFLDTLNLMRADVHPAKLNTSGAAGEAFKSARFKLANRSEQVRRVMMMTGLDVFIESYDDLDAAIASF